jgi:hypothetical protein
MSEQPVINKTRPKITMSDGMVPKKVSEPSVAPVRPPLRDDPRDLAAKRAAELRQHRSTQVNVDDEFDVSYLEERKPGWKFQWAAWSVAEMRQTTNMMNVEARGWSFVSREEFPELMPKDADGDVIMRKGNVLMEIPKEIHDDLRADEIKAARDQVRWKEQSIAGTPEGTLERDRPKIKKSFEAMPIPDK